jgi:hypothetical protein
MIAARPCRKVWVRGLLADQKKRSLAALSLPPGHANDHGVWRGARIGDRRDPILKPVEDLK